MRLKSGVPEIPGQIVNSQSFMKVKVVPEAPAGLYKTAVRTRSYLVSVYAFGTKVEIYHYKRRRKESREFEEPLLHGTVKMMMTTRKKSFLKPKRSVRSKVKQSEIF